MLLQIILVVQLCTTILAHTGIHRNTPTVVPSLRIINGTDAPVGSHPSVVHIAFEPVGFCTGSLISKEHILTAAHCLDNKKGVKYVLLGAHNIQDHAEPSQVKLTSTSTRKHPDYVGGAEHDVAVLKLDSPAKLAKQIQLMTLPKAENPIDFYYSKNATGYGWGQIKTKPFIERAGVLQLFDAKVLPDSDCKPYDIAEDLLCVGRRDGLPGNTCHGDSGGPLIVDGVQIGVLHGHVGDPCEASMVASYPRVDLHLSWILKTMKEL